MNPSWRKNYARYKSYFLNVAGQYKEKENLRAYVEIMLSLATVSLFAVFALRPTLITIAELIKEIESKKTTVDQMDTKIENLSKAQAVYNQERERIILLKSAVPDSPKPEVAVRQIEGLSGSSQSKIVSLLIENTVLVGQEVTPQKSDKKQSDNNMLTLSVGMSAEYPSLFQFLKDFEKLRRPMQIENLSFAKREIEGESVLILTIDALLPLLGTSQEKQ